MIHKIQVILYFLADGDASNTALFMFYLQLREKNEKTGNKDTANKLYRVAKNYKVTLLLYHTHEQLTKTTVTNSNSLLTCTQLI